MMEKRIRKLATKMVALTLLAACDGEPENGRSQKALRAETQKAIITEDPAPDLIKNPKHTSLEKSIWITEGESAYKSLDYGAPWPLITREDLADAKTERTQSRTSLVSFVHITDIHISDSQSPSRTPFVRRYTDPGGDKTLLEILRFFQGMNSHDTQANENTDIALLSDFYKNQELLSAHVAESMVRKINLLTGGPATGTPLSFVINTGDSADNRQKNELQNYINIMNGGDITLDSSGKGYVGIQDYGVTAHTFESNDEYQAYFDQYWHPDPLPAELADKLTKDKFKLDHGFPDYPGLLEAAVRNFKASGLNLPWYAGNGNHDRSVLGNIHTSKKALHLLWNPLGAGNKMLLDVPKISIAKTETLDLTSYVKRLLIPEKESLNDFLETAPIRPIPPNAAREPFTASDFIRAHLETDAETGHGFTKENLENGTMYYRFDIADNIVGIMLDTVNPYGYADGSLGSIQAQWLENQLKENNSRFYNEAGELVTQEKEDNLVILFSHHNLATMNNPLQFKLDPNAKPDPDPQKLKASEVKSLVLRYPNVIAWFNGHSHVNKVWSHVANTEKEEETRGFWEINTSSHIDFPQNSRVIEIVDNNDGTLSIFAILLDHVAQPKADAGDLSLLGLASISRELSANDPDKNREKQVGELSDRNVELIINAPFPRTEKEHDYRDSRLSGL